MTYHTSMGAWGCHMGLTGAGEGDGGRSYGAEKGMVTNLSGGGLCDAHLQILLGSRYEVAVAGTLLTAWFCLQLVVCCS